MNCIMDYNRGSTRLLSLGLLELGSSPCFTQVENLGDQKSLKGLVISTSALTSAILNYHKVFEYFGNVLK